MFEQSEIIERNKSLVEKFIVRYKDVRESYSDDFEMQLCIEEDLSCNEIYDEIEQEILAKHIINVINSQE